jgi:hypothetical protein
MIWLFSPPQKNHAVPSDNNRAESATVSVPLETAQSTGVVHEPDSFTEQQDSSAAAASPRESPVNSSSEKSGPEEKMSANLTQSNHHKTSAFSSLRHLYSNYGKAAPIDSKYRTFLRREIANFKIRLVSLWHRSGLSGSRHRKRSASSE